MGFLFTYLLISYIASICAMFIYFERENDYDDLHVVPQKEYNYGEASEILLRFAFCLILPCAVCVIGLFLYAYAKPAKKSILRKIKKILEESENE